jgi:hypothetical protein
MSNNPSQPQPLPQPFPTEKVEKGGGKPSEKR